MIQTKSFNIDASPIQVLRRIRETTSMSGDTYLRDIKEEEPAIMVTCPFHKNHRERKPACGVFVINYKSFKVGDYHCFACGARGSMVNLVSACLHMESEDAEQWLFNTFGGTQAGEELLPKIELNAPPQKSKIISDKILKQYDYYHPYTDKRGLSREIVDKFRIGYDPTREAITFPVWDEKGRLVAVTARSVRSKKFYIPKDLDKPLYLMNFVLDLSPPMLMVTEAQIDALTAWQYGFPCVATMGTISHEQIKTLTKSGIRIFIDAFDNDEYGEKFSRTFKKNMPKDILIYRLPFPKGKKDINDLSSQEFNDCLNKLGISWKIQQEN